MELPRGPAYCHFNCGWAGVKYRSGRAEHCHCPALATASNFNRRGGGNREADFKHLHFPDLIVSNQALYLKVSILVIMND